MASSSSSVANPKHEDDIIGDLARAAQARSKEGDTFYLLNQRWWNEWIEYCFQIRATNGNTAGLSNVKRPSAIDNSNLINEAAESISYIELHDTLMEGIDYIIVPEKVWKQLHAWYGGGPTLARKVILSNGELSVEVYPLRLHLHLTPKSGNSTIRLSKMETIRDLYKKASGVFYLRPEQILIWDYYNLSRLAVLSQMEQTLEGANVQMDQDILVEIVDNGVSSTGKRIAGSDDPHVLDIDHFTSPGHEPRNNIATGGVSAGQFPGGLIGLANLGNTCYLNSAIQCLAHTSKLSTYFMEDIQRGMNQQPLDKPAELTLAFVDLLKKLWKPRRTSVAPTLFKRKLANFAPNFDDGEQHDSQELLVSLLDGLHENLNRGKFLQHINLRDANGRSDEDIADEYWTNYKAHNDSIIVDLFHGQYKSTIVCQVCNKVSATFDPFMSVSLAIQPKTTRSMTITVFTSDGSAPPSVYLVNVSKRGRCRDLVQAIDNVCSLQHDEKFLLAQIKMHLIDRFLEDQMPLSSIKDDDIIVAYKVPKNQNNKKILQLIHRIEDWQDGKGGNTTGWKPFGIPLISSISYNGVITGSHVRLKIHRMLSPMLRIMNGGNRDSFVASNQPKFPLHLIDESNSCIDLSIDETKAIKCSSSSKVMHVFMDWSKKLLEEFDTSFFENMPKVGKYGVVTNKNRNENLSLYTCLDSYLREEPLRNEHMWYCPQCETHRQARKKLDLWRLPEVLVFHLKRFSFSTLVKKLETFVDFPLCDLDLTNYVPNKRNLIPQLYELYAVINHYGDMGNGHYTSHIKILEENRWYNFDDKQVTPISEDKVKSSSAYVLFYKRIRDDDRM